MNPILYLQELSSEIRSDKLEEYDRIIHVLDAFYQIKAITDKEFLVGLDFLIENLEVFGFSREGVEEMFTSIPDRASVYEANC